MNWLRANRSTTLILGLFAAGICGALACLLMAKSDWNDASNRFRNTAAEWKRLERLSPYPNAENLRRMKVHAEDYSRALAQLKNELKGRAAPVVAMAPTDFQTQLQLRLTAITDKARANKVKLPDRFHLGFDEFVSALPNEAAAPLLGRELAQIEWLLNTLLEARVDAVTAFRRTSPERERTPASVSPSDAKSVQRNVVEATFVSTPGAARKVINQITAANEQFCVIRLLHVRNERQKGPPREQADDPASLGSTMSAPSPGAKPSPASPLSFIVGHERIETTARIEIVRFAL